MLKSLVDPNKALGFVFLTIFAIAIWHTLVQKQVDKIAK